MFYLLCVFTDLDETRMSESTRMSPAMSEPLVLVFALIACTIFLVCFLMMWMCIPKVGTTKQSAPM